MRFRAWDAWFKNARPDNTRALFTGADNEVWSFGEEAYPILTNYMALCETMRDYVRSLMRQAHEDGSPVMRATKGPRY